MLSLLESPMQSLLVMTFPRFFASVASQSAALEHLQVLLWTIPEEKYKLHLQHLQLITYKVHDFAIAQLFQGIFSNTCFNYFNSCVSKRKVIDATICKGAQLNTK